MRGYPLVIKRGRLENPRTKWRLKWNIHQEMGGFSIAMFDYWRVSYLLFQQFWGLKPARNEDMVDNRHLRCWCKNGLRVWGWGDDLFNGDGQSGMELIMAIRNEFPSLGPYGIC